MKKDWDGYIDGFDMSTALCMSQTWQIFIVGIRRRKKDFERGLWLGINSTWNEFPAYCYSILGKARYADVQIHLRIERKIKKAEDELKELSGWLRQKKRRKQKEKWWENRYWLSRLIERKYERKKADAKTGTKLWLKRNQKVNRNEGKTWTDSLRLMNLVLKTSSMEWFAQNAWIPSVTRSYRRTCFFAQKRATTDISCLEFDSCVVQKHKEVPA